jgi:hydroxymethylpyrimidine pyrophosphatase-like HAD family hydrolase
MSKVGLSESRSNGFGSYFQICHRKAATFAFQGLILYDGDGSILYERYMDDEIAQRIIKLGAQEGVTVTAYCGNRM